ncbi:MULTISPECIES: hypothetical protein [Pyrobaculum]|uniref:Uncharacterized protein n=1 Tax=Pyrobaculum arsenaticum (strain DSM 13514 / JCM 11321 / PZ6) TaxID=340102 RepID=A4WHZ8_PYRAR|nr:hypothetical protein [Pyrobaculum arsenaticum]ABP50015.1 conserved hypothetical protein [Pyrobaculum arsenaticum DSM 13514]MCY0890219.1 hypothetical protein [Pyrobaculum arsenaticum]
MDVSEIVAILLTKGVDRVLSDLPSLIKEKKIEKDDLQLILLYAAIENLKNINTKLDEVKKEVASVKSDIRDLGNKLDTMNKDLRERLDLIINQMRVLNSNIAATYELTSKVVAKLMERGIAPLA